MKNEFDYLNDVKMDFSVYSEKQLSEKELRHMKKNGNTRIRKRIFIAAAAAVVALTGTAFASGLAGNIIKTLSTGYNTVVQTDPNEKMELPEELRGIFYDENGAPLDELSQTDFDNIYDSDGNKIDKKRYAEIIADVYDGTVKTNRNGEIKVTFAHDDADDHEHDFASIEEAEEAASFDIKTLEKLPEGYALDRVYTYTDDSENYSGDYMTLIYAKGSDDIIIYERAINDQTTFEMSTENEIEEISLNGCKAVIDGESSVSWETADNVSVSIQVHGGLTKAEMLDFAASVK